MRIAHFIRSNVVAVLFALVLAFPASAQVEDKETVRVTTELMQAGVTVVDKNGRFVDGLKKEQFEVRVDGVARPISFLEQVIAGTAGEQNRLARIGKTDDSGIPPATQDSEATVRGRTIVFFVDDLHLSLDSLKRTRESLLYFIEHRLGSRDQVAIVSASGQIGFLQQFTSNRAVLRAAAGRLQHRVYNVQDTEQPTMSEYMAVKITERDRDALSYYVGRCLDENRGYTPPKCGMLVRDRAREIIRRATTVTDKTFSTLNSMMQSTSRMPGRKLVLLISDGFYLHAREGSAYSNFESVTDTARRTGTLIYTVDARGLISGQPDATVNLVDGNGVLDRAAIGEIARSQDGLNALAVDTGGRATRNSTSMTDWVRTTLDETTNYYMLAWHSDPEEVDAKFKKVEVSILGRPELTVRQPRGYLTSAAVRKQTKASREKSRPDSTQGTTIENKLDPDVGLGRLPVTLSLSYIDIPEMGGVVTSSIQVSGSDLANPAAAKTSTIDLAGIVFNDQGKQVGDFKTGLAIDEAMTGNGRNLIYNARTRLTPGIYQIKVAAKEQRTGRVGSTADWIEVPDLARGELTLGSLFLDFKQVTSAGKFDVAQVQFSVDHVFGRPLDLSFLSFVYNAAAGVDGKPNLTSKIEIVDEKGNIVTSWPPRNVSPQSVVDPRHIPVGGEIRQQLATGTYLLRLTVNDTVKSRTAVQTTLFYIR